MRILGNENFINLDLIIVEKSTRSLGLDASVDGGGLWGEEAEVGF